MKRTAIKRRGKKTAEWDRVRAEIKKKFEAHGVTTCELRGSQCWNRGWLSFAHSKKRRLMQGTDIWEVALLCTVCHQNIEAKSHEEMARIVREIIANRGWNCLPKERDSPFLTEHNSPQTFLL